MSRIHSLVLAFALAACTHEDSLETANVDEVTTALEAPVCVADELACGNSCVDANTDPNNCGACGNVCGSGLCYWGVCGDDRPGNLFVIGHSYEKSNRALDRLLANAVGTANDGVVDVLIYRGTNSATLAWATNDAIARGSNQTFRPNRRTFTPSSSAAASMLPSFDVLVIAAQPQMSDAELAVVASDLGLAMDDHLRRGGVVIALDAPSTNNSGTATVLRDFLPVRRATSAPGAVASVSAFENASVGSLPMTFALGNSVGYAATDYTNAVTTESGDVLVAHRSFY